MQLSIVNPSGVSAWYGNGSFLGRASTVNSGESSLGSGPLPSSSETIVDAVHIVKYVLRCGFQPLNPVQCSLQCLHIPLLRHWQGRDARGSEALKLVGFATRWKGGKRLTREWRSDDVGVVPRSVQPKTWGSLGFPLLAAGVARATTGARPPLLRGGKKGRTTATSCCTGI